MHFFLRFLLVLMAGVAGPLATSHGGDGGGEDPRRPSHIPAQCDEPRKTIDHVCFSGNILEHLNY